MWIDLLDGRDGRVVEGARFEIACTEKVPWVRLPLSPIIEQFIIYSKAQLSPQFFKKFT